MAATDPDYISSDCAIAGRQIEQGIGAIACAENASSHAVAHRLRVGMTTAMAHISADSLMTLEAYAKARADFRAKVIAHKKERTVALGDHVTLIFEDELTIRYQIQEMLRVERIFEAEGIRDELDAYNPLIPDGTNWKATMLIEYPDVEERRTMLAALRGIEDRVWVQVARHATGIRVGGRGHGA